MSINYKIYSRSIQLLLEMVQPPNFLSNREGLNIQTCQDKIGNFILARKLKKQCAFQENIMQIIFSKSKSDQLEKLDDTKGVSTSCRCHDIQQIFCPLCMRISNRLNSFTVSYIKIPVYTLGEALYICCVYLWIERN